MPVRCVTLAGMFLNRLSMGVCMRLVRVRVFMVRVFVRVIVLTPMVRMIRCPRHPSGVMTSILVPLMPPRITLRISSRAPTFRASAVD